MAVETLYEGQEEATRILEIDYREVQDLQLPRLAMKDIISIDNQEVVVMRAHSGDPDMGMTGKGGIRMHNYPTAEDGENAAKELAVEMRSKLALRGHGDNWMGAKGVIMLDGRNSSLNMKQRAMAQFAGRMFENGLAGHDTDVPAGDVGVGPALTDVYASTYHRLNPTDAFWRASITGKSPGMEGTDFRIAATSWGTFVTQRTLMDYYGHDKARTTVQGFGNVGGYHAYFASQDPEGRMPVDAISDIGGMVYTDDPRGFDITLEMVEQIANNPDFAGDPNFARFQGRKILALAEMIAQNQPDLEFKLSDNPDDILERPCDYFVPAAMGNVITADNVGRLGARLGVIEAGNGTTTPAADRYLVDNGIIVGADILANGAGVDASIQEWDANLRMEHLSADKQQQMLEKTSERVTREAIRTAEAMQTRSLRVGAIGLSIVRMLEAEHPTYARELGLKAA